MIEARFAIRRGLSVAMLIRHLIITHPITGAATRLPVILGITAITASDLGSTWFQEYISGEASIAAADLNGSTAQ